MAIFKQVEKTTESKNRLLHFGYNVTSRCGEDGVIEKIFEIIQEKNRWCVEVSASIEKKYSNVYNLLTHADWRGILVESGPATRKEMQKTFRWHVNVRCINTSSDLADPHSLDNTLSETGTPEDFDLLSLSMGGEDYHLWDSVQKYRPKVVVIQYDPAFKNDLIFIYNHSRGFGNGSSLAAILELGSTKGYVQVCTTASSVIFVKKAYGPLFRPLLTQPAPRGNLLQRFFGFKAAS